MEYLNLIVKYWGVIVAALGILGIGIENTKWININPYSSLFGWIGKKINKETNSKIDALSIDVENVKKELDLHTSDSDKKEAKRLRGEILDFANSCRNKRKHRMEEFEHIMDVYADYHRYVEERNLENGYLDEEYQYILDVFRECQRTDSFLK